MTPRYAFRLAVWAFWRLALAALLCVLTWQAYNLRNLPGWAQAQIQREGDNTRTAALVAIADTRKDLLKEVASIRTDVMARTDKALDITDQTSKMVDTRLADITTKMTAQLDKANASIAEVAKVREDLRPVLGEAQETLNQTSGTIAVLRPQALGLMAATKVTMGTVAQTMRTVKDATPKLADATVQTGQNVAGITKDFHTFTSEFVKPQPWYKKLYTGAKDGLLIGSRFF